MLNVLFEAHSGWRYLVIAVAVVVVVKYLIGLFAKTEWSGLDRGLGSAFPIVVDIQVLLGLVLWLMAPTAWFHGRGTVTVWEHLVTMVLVLAVAHIGSVRIKRAESSQAKYKVGLISYVIAGVLLGIGVARITGVM